MAIQWGEALWPPGRAVEWTGMRGPFSGSYPKKSCCTFILYPGSWVASGQEGKFQSARSGYFLWADPTGTDLRAQGPDEQASELWSPLQSMLPWPHP